MEPLDLIILALSLMAAGVLMFAFMLLGQVQRKAQGTRYLDRVMAGEPDHAAGPDSVLQAAGGAAASPPRWPAHWVQTRLGQLLVAAEDRRLIEQCGLPPGRTQLVFLLARTALALLLPLAVWLVFGPAAASPRKLYFGMACAFVFGFMAPKWGLQAYARRRRERVAQELPIFVDMLGLLQSVGLSLDQSLQTLSRDFRHVLPILSHEIAAASRAYYQGRSREHSLQHLVQLNDNQQLVDLVALLVQVDKHGGAIQQPLRQFAERLREQRKSDMKATVGKIAVKMTVVMVTTLLPSLIIITAGPGFLAVIRALGTVAK